MKQYIDKATVVAEIKRRVEAIRKAFNEPGILSGVDRTYACAQYEAFKSLFPFLDTLETKDVEIIEIPVGTDNKVVDEIITFPNSKRCYAYIQGNKIVIRKFIKKKEFKK